MVSTRERGDPQPLASRRFKRFIWRLHFLPKWKRAATYQARRAFRISFAASEDARRIEERAERGVDPYQTSKRQERFFLLYYRRVQSWFATNPKGRPTKTILVDLAADCLAPAGYRTKPRRKDGSLTRRGDELARTLIGLPRTQHALDQMFERAGLSLEDCADVIQEVAKSTDNEPSDRLKAVDMRIRMTVGYAPTRSQSVNVNLHKDKMFDEAVFADGTPPSLEE